MKEYFNVLCSIERFFVEESIETLERMLMREEFAKHRNDRSRFGSDQEVALVDYDILYVPTLHFQPFNLHVPSIEPI